MKKILLMLVAVVILSSCSTKKLAYFTDISEMPAGSITAGHPGLKIKPGDELFITVTSEVPEATVAYNLPLSNPGSMTGKMEIGSDVAIMTSQVKQQTYIVDRQGDISFPVLGRIHVEGMTTGQLTAELTNRISQNVDDPYVRVELINFRVKVLGDVTKPDSYDVKGETMTVLDALAMAGDMTPYGRRDNVLVIRQNGDQTTYERLDLRDSKAITSPYFYLQQNDVVYVEPSKGRLSQADSQNNAYKINVISAIVSGVSVISSLIIAITR